MTRIMITSDLHLGHKNIHKFRDAKTAEAHHEFVFERLATSINKRDSVIFLGDIAFDQYWLNKIKSINCAKSYWFAVIMTRITVLKCETWLMFMMMLFQCIAEEITGLRIALFILAKCEEGLQIFTGIYIAKLLTTADI